MKKVCLNPSCKKRFAPGHYGDRQRVCGSPSCRTWYKGYWSQMRKPPRGIPDDDFKRILAAVKDDPFWRSLFVAARETGLRKGELLGLTWGDVLGRDGQVRSEVAIRGQWDDRRGFVPTKTRASRAAYLSTRARGEILLVPHETGKGRAFLEKRIWPVSESYTYSRFVEIQRALKIANPETGEPYRFHDLRHTVGVELVRAGKIDLAQKMLGHRNVETTMQYSQRSAAEILREVEAVRAGSSSSQKIR